MLYGNDNKRSMKPIFSTYSQQENRVTSTIMAVLERLPFRIVEVILQRLIEADGTENLLKFENQSQGKKNNSSGSIPDAFIGASFGFWIETKIRRNTLKSQQLERHLDHVNDDGAKRKYENRYLLVITPDIKKPECIARICGNNGNNNSLCWVNFSDFCEIISRIADHNQNEWKENLGFLLAERDRDLLKELYHFIKETKGLLGEDEVLIIPARVAFDEFKKYGAYVCQQNRPFRYITHIGFYRNKRIERNFPKVIARFDSLRLTGNIIEDNDDRLVPDQKDLLKRYGDKLCDLYNKIKRDGYRTTDELGFDDYQIFLLDAKNGIILDEAIRHERGGAWVQGQRYIPLAALDKSPKTTDDLVDE